jgi:hypothetical protein
MVSYSLLFNTNEINYSSTTNYSPNFSIKGSKRRTDKKKEEKETQMT